MPRLCQQFYCQKGASFGPKDSKTPRYCATHEPVGYVNVKTRCQEDGCYKFPHFGFSSSKATSCVTHMKDGMINLRVRKCLEPGCTTRAVFNVVGSDKSKFCAKCAKHKKAEMIDIKLRFVNIRVVKKSALCCRESSQTFCGLHKQDGMINIASRKRAHSDCYTRPYFNVPGNHKANTALDTKQLVRLAKQLRVKYILDVNNILYEAYDSIVEDCVCSKKRPDFVIDADTHKVVLEVDEYQHKKGEYNCEVKRM